MAANDHPARKRSSTAQLSLGLRWLESDAVLKDKTPNVRVASWPEFLAKAEQFPSSGRLRLARLWPLLALINGVLAMTGLMIWPERSGVHLLLFLMAFLGLPVVMWLWVAIAGLGAGRAPWWRWLVTRYDDPVITLWCLRQSLISHLLFVLSGLAWLWVMLATRQIIFYWGTSIEAVSQRVETLVQLISAGVLQAPSKEAIVAAEAGFITGWRSALLGDSLEWAQWLTQALGLWVLLPVALLLVFCQIRLRWSLARWPLLNHRLRQCYEQQHSPDLHYRALQPEQPVIEDPGRSFRVRGEIPREPAFTWQWTDAENAPPGSIALGRHGFAEDEALVMQHAVEYRYWIIGADTVPTGDLADLLAIHRRQGGDPHLVVLLSGGGKDQVDVVSHTWGAFLARNNLALALELACAPGDNQRHG